MPKLIDLKTNKAQEVSYDNLQQALSSGQFAPAEGESLNFYNPQGEAVNLPSSEAFKALQQGFTVPKQFEVDAARKENALQAEYGEGLGSELKAAALGAASGATFGAAPALLEKTGLVSKEALTELPKRNPLSHGAGFGAGAIGTAVATGGGATAALARNPVVSQAIGKIGTAALGSAIEGAAFSAGNLVSEAALGDPNLNGERAAADLARGFLTGALVGGAFGAASEALPAVFSKAKSLLKSGKDSFVEGAAKASSKLTGQSVDDIMAAYTNQADALSPAQFDDTAQRLGEAFNKQYTAVNKAVKSTYERARAVETASLLDDTHLPGAMQEVDRVRQTLRAGIEAVEVDPEAYSKGFLKSMRQAESSLAGAEADTAASIFEKINDAKKALDPLMKYNKTLNMLPPDVANTVQLVSGLRTGLKDSLENEAIWGRAATRQSAMNEAFNEFKTIQSELEKSFTRKEITTSGRPVRIGDTKKIALALKNPDKAELLKRYQDASRNLLDQIEQTHAALPGSGFKKSAHLSTISDTDTLQGIMSKHIEQKQLLKGLTGAEDGMPGIAEFAAYKLLGPAGALGAAGIKTLQNPGLMIQRLGNIERMLNKVSTTIADQSDNIFKGAASIRPVFVSGAAFKPSSVEKEMEQISELATNPDKMQARLEGAGVGGQDAAPNTTVAMQASLGNAVGFLASKLPPKVDTGYFGAPAKYSFSDLVRFNAYAETVKDPISVLKHVKQGTLVPQHIEALQSVYPKMYQDMQKSVLQALAKSGTTKAAPKLQNTLSMFLGQNLSPSLNPASLQALQASLQGPTQAVNTQVAGGANKGSLKALNVSGQVSTPMQKSIRREE